MPSLPAVRAAETIRALERAGFARQRQHGSHVFLFHESTRRSTTVPVHKGDLSPRLLRGIIQQAGLTVEEFIELLRG